MFNKCSNFAGFVRFCPYTYLQVQTYLFASNIFFEGLDIKVDVDRTNKNIKVSRDLLCFRCQDESEPQFTFCDVILNKGQHRWKYRVDEISSERRGAITVGICEDTEVGDIKMGQERNFVFFNINESQHDLVFLGSLEWDFCICTKLIRPCLDVNFLQWLQT